MNKKFLLCLACLLSLAGSRAFAIPMVFEFNYHDSDTGGDVAGIILGLDSNGLGQQATSVTVLSNTAGFGIGEYVGNPVSNSWDVIDGVITAVQFLSWGYLNEEPDVVCCTLTFLTLPPVIGGVVNSPDEPGNIYQVTITPFTPDPPVPAPHTLLLVLAGLTSLAAVRKSK